MIQKTKLKKEFNKQGFQITKDAVDMLDDHIARQVKIMAKRTKEGNVKRLTANLVYVALGNLNLR